MKRRIPLAATTYLITLAAFVLLWVGITLLQARSDQAWTRAGDTGLASEQQALGVLLARAHQQPWEVEDLAQWHRHVHPNLKFALYEADGDLVTGYGLEDLPEVDFASLDWAAGDLIVLEDGVEVSRNENDAGQLHYAITRYVLSPGQWRVTYFGYGIGIAFVGLVWLIVAGVFGWLYAAPLRRMASTARELSSGNFAARTGITRSDELGVLAGALDQMTERLGGMVEAQQVLMAQVSHELRTPLARLRVALDLVDGSDGDEAKAQVLEMSHDLLELERLVSDVLAMARLDVAVARGTTSIELRRDRIEPSTFIAAVLDRFGRAHPARDLERAIAPGLPPIEVDGVLIGRVLMNLLANAHKYSPRARPLRVRAIAVDGCLEVRVDDEGPGIPAGDLERVFAPFYRGRAATDSTSGGFGLGLSLCRRAARMYGGDVTVSNRPGGGVEALLILPLFEPDPIRESGR